MRLALRSSDMTATCAVPPGNPTSQMTSGWQMLLPEGKGGLVKCAFSSVEDNKERDPESQNYDSNYERLLGSGRRMSVYMMCTPFLHCTHIEENCCHFLSSCPPLKKKSNGFHMPLSLLLTTTMGLMSPETRGLNELMFKGCLAR